MQNSRNYNRGNRIPPILLKISVLVEGTGSYSEKKSVRSTLPKLGDTAIWNFAKCVNFRRSGQVRTVRTRSGQGPDGPDKVRTQIKTKKPFNSSATIQMLWDFLDRVSCSYWIQYFSYTLSWCILKKKWCSTRFTVGNLTIASAAVRTLFSQCF